MTTRIRHFKTSPVYTTTRLHVCLPIRVTGRTRHPKRRGAVSRRRNPGYREHADQTTDSHAGPRAHQEFWQLPPADLITVRTTVNKHGTAFQPGCHFLSNLVTVRYITKYGTTCGSTKPWYGEEYNQVWRHISDWLSLSVAPCYGEEYNQQIWCHISVWLSLFIKLCYGEEYNQQIWRNLSVLLSFSIKPCYGEEYNQIWHHTSVWLSFPIKPCYGEEYNQIIMALHVSLTVTSYQTLLRWGI